jgi:hypothetical protein
MGCSGSANTVLPPGDALVLEATPDALDEFRTALSLAFADKKARGSAAMPRATGSTLVEVVVPKPRGSPARPRRASGCTGGSANGADGHLAPGPQDHEPGAQDTVIRPGDILLLLVPKATGGGRDRMAGLPAAGGSRAGGDRRTARPGWPSGSFAAAVLASLGGLATCPSRWADRGGGLCADRGSCRCRALHHIEWPVVVLLGSMIPLGAALEDRAGPS